MRIRRALTAANPKRRIDSARDRLDRQDKAVASHGRRLDKQAARLEALEKGTKLLRSDLDRIEHQLATLEEKVERVARERDEPPVVGDRTEVEQARNVVDAVQREHEQIRVRFQVVTRYEERLRRVEDSVFGPEAAGDAEP